MGVDRNKLKIDGIEIKHGEISDFIDFLTGLRKDIISIGLTLISTDFFLVSPVDVDF